MSASISLVDYAKNNPSLSIKKKIDEINDLRMVNIATTIGILILGSLIFCLMVSKYHGFQSLPSSHYYVSLGFPYTLSLVFGGIAGGATYCLHKKRPIEELKKDFPKD